MSVLDCDPAMIFDSVVSIHLGDHHQLQLALHVDLQDQGNHEFSIPSRGTMSFQTMPAAQKSHALVDIVQHAT